MLTGILVDSWQKKKAFRPCQLFTKTKYSVIYIIALEESYEEFLCFSGTKNPRQNAFGEYIASHSCFARYLASTLGLEHPDTLGSMANLASTYGNQCRLKRRGHSRSSSPERSRSRSRSGSMDAPTGASNAKRSSRQYFLAAIPRSTRRLDLFTITPKISTCKVVEAYPKEAENLEIARFGD